MSTAPATLPRRGFLETARRDTGGSSRWPSSPSLFVVSSSTPLGGLPGTRITWLGLTSRRSTRRSSSAPSTPGSVRTLLVARVPALLAGAPDPGRSRGVPIHVLLLPRGLLQGVLGRPAVLRRGRAAFKYRGENSLPLILQNMHRYFLYLSNGVPPRARVRRLGGALVRTPPRGARGVRRRGGHDRPRDQPSSFWSPPLWVATPSAISGGGDYDRVRPPPSPTTATRAGSTPTTSHSPGGV